MSSILNSSRSVDLFDRLVSAGEMEIEFESEFVKLFMSDEPECGREGMSCADDEKRAELPPRLDLSADLLQNRSWLSRDTAYMKKEQHEKRDNFLSVV